MKISEIIKDKYKLRIPPTVYYDLLADVVEAEEEQELKTGHWINPVGDNAFCECCGRLNHYYGDYCKCCGAKMD